eukprot:jgi/Undpi1/3392/HiC_scaffold_15.g06765.m1
MIEPEVTGSGVEDGAEDDDEVSMGAVKGMGPKRPSTGSMSARATANLMLEAKNTRKRAEADVHLLANRLAHLQAEEEKARRKTEETKIRAAEIKRLKQQNQDLARARETSARAHGKDMSDHERAVAERKNKQQRDLQSTKANLEKQRKTNAKTAREQRQALQMTYQELRARTAAENRQRTEVVRKQREAARLKKEAEQREREAKQQEEHRRRISIEKQKTQEAENMIEKMEQDEDVLIERLKKIQEEQRRAYELLQESLES